MRVSPSIPYSFSSNVKILFFTEPKHGFSLWSEKKQELAQYPFPRADALCSSLQSAHIPSMLSAIFTLWALYLDDNAQVLDQLTHDHRILFQEELQQSSLNTYLQWHKSSQFQLVESQHMCLQPAEALLSLHWLKGNSCICTIGKLRNSSPKECIVEQGLFS